MLDLSSQFYLTEKDIGRNRAEASYKQLCELNEYVQVQCFTTPLSEDLIGKYDVLVFTEATHEELLHYSDICRSRGKKMVACNGAGLFGRIFVDFGPKHLITDPSGRQLNTYPIQDIIRKNPAEVTIVEGEVSSFQDGSTVTFSDVEGMTEINGVTAEVTTINSRRFQINIDTSAFHEYTGNGYVTEVNIPKTISHHSYREETEAGEPHLNMLHATVNFERPQSLYSIFMALSEFVKQNPSLGLPRSHNVEDSKKFAAIAESIHKKIYSSLYTADTTVTNKSPFEIPLAQLVARVARGNFGPLCAILGGIAGQEVIKAVTNKLTPINQWLFIDNSQVLGYGIEEADYDLDALKLPSEASCTPLNCRYDGQIAIFGKEFQDHLSNMKYFLVGAGAIGCEALKNFALMGLAAGKNGLLTVTDMDTIELSNLSRQFLFRPKDISKPKSETAAAAIKAINPSLNIRALTQKVGSGEQEMKVFPPEFWQSLDGVCNALDNLQARLFVDQQCVQYCKPLFESGTLGTQGNTQSIIPHLTENYGAFQDPEQNALAMCTVRNLPYLIEHTIEYARTLFVDSFTDTANDAANYLRDPDRYIERISGLGAQKNTVLAALEANTTFDCPHTFDDCIAWGRRLFERVFVNQIRQLLFNFPPDAKTSYGVPFWSGSNRIPSPTPFDPSNPDHVNFIACAAYIRANNYGIAIPGTHPEDNPDHLEMDLAHIADVAKKTPIPEFVPHADASLAQEVEDKNKSEGAASAASSSALPDDDALVKSILARLPKKGTKEFDALHVTGIEFEKDDDENRHIDFIYYCANLRAINYNIHTADRARIKLISGRITPAIATTTALVSGLTMCDLCTYHRGDRRLDAYRSWFANLADATFLASAPQPATKFEDTDFTIWDRITLRLNHVPTISEVFDILRKDYKWEIYSTIHGESNIFNRSWPADKKEKYSQLPLPELVKAVEEKELENGTEFLTLEISGISTETKNLVDMPPVAVFFPPLKH